MIDKVWGWLNWLAFVYARCLVTGGHDFVEGIELHSDELYPGVTFGRRRRRCEHCGIVRRVRGWA